MTTTKTSPQVAAEHDIEAVLAAHTVELLVPAGWEGEGDWEAECSCGDRFMVETGSEGELVHRTHVAEVLAAAGYRKVEAGK